MITKIDTDMFADYLKDASNFKGNADLLIIPENVSELKDAIKYCFERKIPITVSGAGTGLCGARVPLSGAIISTELLNRIIEINPNNLTAKVQPGVLYSELETELNRHNLFLPPNPTEKDSSIGGNVSTNASGAKSFKYGSYRNFVNSLKIILANGDEIQLTRGQNQIRNNSFSLEFSGKTIHHFFKEIHYPDVKNASGYYLKNDADLIDLFISSEGTLGVYSEIELRLQEQPENLMGGVVFFDNLSGMLGFVENLRDLSKTNNLLDYQKVTGLSARLIEFFDEKALNLVKEQFPQIPVNAIASVWFEQEYSSENEDKIMNSWYDFIKEYTILADKTWFALNRSEHDKLREFRHAVPEKVSEIIAGYGTRKVGTDSSVPFSAFSRFYNFINAEIQNCGIDNMLWGHFGDAHFHANFLPKNSAEFDVACRVADRIIEQTLLEHGSVSAEHGIGKIKKDFLRKMYGDDSIDEMKKIKELFDSENLLGQGNLF